VRIIIARKVLSPENARSGHAETPMNRFASSFFHGRRRERERERERERGREARELSEIRSSYLRTLLECFIIVEISVYRHFIIRTIIIPTTTKYDSRSL